VAHPDLDQILNVLLPFAQKMLSKYGEFQPFAASMDQEGRVALHAGYTGEQRVTSEQIIDLLIGGIRQQASNGEIKAAGICLDVRTVPPGQVERVEAICAQLEHETGEAADVYLPYRKSWLRGPKYGDLFAARGKRTLFGP
jgi:hypothetical protein